MALAGKTVPLTFVRTYTDMYKSKATFLFNKMQLLKFGIVEDMLEYPFFLIKYEFRSVGILYAVYRIQVVLPDDSIVACLNEDQRCNS